MFNKYDNGFSDQTKFYEQNYKILCAYLCVQLADVASRSSVHLSTDKSG